MNCPGCERPTRPGAKFCETCGTPLGDNSARPDAKATAGKSGKRMSGSDWFGVLLGVAAVVFIGVRFSGAGEDSAAPVTSNVTPAPATASPTKTAAVAPLNVVGVWICTTTNPNGSTSTDHLELGNDDSLRFVSGDTVMLGDYVWEAPRIAAHITSIPAMVDYGVSPVVDRQIDFVVESHKEDSFNASATTDSGTRRTTSCKRG